MLNRISRLKGKTFIFFPLVFFLTTLFAGISAAASDEPFISPSNSGQTGLLEIPTARFMKENTFRFGVSHIHPYRYYYGTVGIFEGLEINGRITEVLGVKVASEAFKGYGNYKDKAIDIKYRFIAEGKYMPAVALGLMDLHGTRLYSSQYVVASKQVYPFDFTVGFGNGRFGRKPLPRAGEGLRLEILSNPKAWVKEAQLFWGVQFAPEKSRYALMFEYSPIRYDKQTNDPAQAKHFTRAVPSPFNVGLRFRPTNWTELDLSYQRGNRIGVSFSMLFDIGRPLIPIYDPKYREAPEDAASGDVIHRLNLALSQSGFTDIALKAEGGHLLVRAGNNKYYYTPRALEVILRLVAEINPPEIDSVRIVLEENGIAQVELKAKKEDIIELHKKRLGAREFFYLSEINTGIRDVPAARKTHKTVFNYGMKPALQMFLNDPSGFFKYRLGLKGWAGAHPWKGASVIGGLEYYPFNTVSTTNEPLSIPVRSDIALYKKSGVALGELMLEQMMKTGGEVHGRLAAGLLEVQYAGLDGELAKPLFDGRLLVGVSGSVVKKRSPDEVFGLARDGKTYWTAFLNTRLNIPEHEASVELKTGRFLAGDKGTRVTVSKFIGGVILSAWYSFTDTSMFSDRFNRGYHDKGVAVTIPIRLFKGVDSKSVYSYALSPWTRDVAQDIEHHNNLFDFIGRRTKIYLDKDTAGNVLK